jgi:DNA repair exonuclease SbcCD nuclease subunit
VRASDTHLGYRQCGLIEHLDDWSRPLVRALITPHKTRQIALFATGDLFISNKVDHTSLIHAIEMLRALQDADTPFSLLLTAIMTEEKVLKRTPPSMCCSG